MPAKLVTYFGSVYRLTAKQWKNYVEHRAAGGTVEILHFGKCLGPVTDITEWTSFDAQREQFEVRQAS